MKIMPYLQSLLPTFTSGRMREDLTLVREDLKHNVIPVYTSMMNAYGKTKFQAKELRDFEEYFDGEVKTKFRGGSVAVIDQCLKRMYENTDVLERMINQGANDVVREAMSFQKVNILQYLEVMSFTIKYARKHLLWVVAVEGAAVDPEGGPGSSLVPADVEWLQNKRQAFFTAIMIMSGEKADTQKLFDEIPDIIATKDNVPMIEKTVGVTKTDPFKFGLIPTWLNPIYHIRMRVAEYQVAKFKAAQKEKEVLEMRILDMKQRTSGKKDAHLQQAIEYNEARLQKLNYELAQMEEDYSHA